MLFPEGKRKNVRSKRYKKCWITFYGETDSCVKVSLGRREQRRALGTKSEEAEWYTHIHQYYIYLLICPIYQPSLKIQSILHFHITSDSSSDALELKLTYEPRLRWSANPSTPTGVHRLQLFHELQYATGTHQNTAGLCARRPDPGVWSSRGSALGVFQGQVRAVRFIVCVSA